MTDLLTPTEIVDDGDLPERRTFRAATLDEAVAAARSELGSEVELVEAHRVRRGGLGGFFATDLGVEIVAERRRPTAVPQRSGAPQPPIVDPAPLRADLPAGGDEVATALDQLIRRAEAIDGAPLPPTESVIGEPAA